MASRAAPPEEADARQAIVARLTQRFCPGCRAPLAVDSPEGMCPACLLAGGLALESSPPLANGMVATTPPSGSQPPATGEWADLAQRFPQLEILELLGRGGMGTVYKVRQKNLDRIIALKVIPPDAAKDPAFAERFARESRAMARMNHPNIVTVYDSGHEGELYWLMMEYVDGVNLRHTLRDGHLQPREALAIVPQICDALQYAHDQGVVHRDIKPENVLLDRTGRVKIADFGLAKLLGKGPDDFTLTRTQQVMGTPRYMAPEQIEKPTTVDHRADIYSLGVVLYEMLTGELPLGRFEPPSHKVQVDVRIDQVVLRALEKAPERRYQRASEVKTELASAASWPPLPAAANEATSVAHAASAPPRNAPAPEWHTPSPASKGATTPFPTDPGGYPLGQVLFVAAGIVLGILVATGGLFALLFGVIRFGPQGGGDLWSWVGSGFGCLVGGLGAAAGSYNTYRQMAGAEDLMRSPRVTWFDWVMRAYAMLGITLIAAGLLTLPQMGRVDEPFIALMTLGGIVTLQGGMFLLWRMLVRPAAVAGHMVSGDKPQVPAEPSYLRAAVLPSAAILAVLLVLIADVHFALPVARGFGGVTPRMMAYRGWHEALLIASMVVVPLCLLGLGAWRTWGPRALQPDGRWTVPVPLAHPLWLWAAGLIAALSLFLPWFQLEFVPGAEVRVIGASGGGTVTIHPTESVLKDIAGMRSGWRYAHRGIQQGSQAAAAAMLIFALFMAGYVFQSQQVGRIIFLLVFGGMALLIWNMQLHRGADQDQKIVIDETTAEGIALFKTRAGGPPLAEWRQAIAPAFVARPSLGAWAMLAACGLAILIGVTELSWGVVAPTAGAVNPAQPPLAAKAAVDPAREAIRRRVAGPAIGLMLAGLLGFVPIVLALLAIPTATLVPSEPQQDTGRGDSPWDAKTEAVVTPGFIPLMVMGPGLNATGATNTLAPHLILAAESYDAPMDTMLRGMMMLAVLLLLSLPISLTLIIGGWRMRQLKSYGLSLVAAILALLPCGAAWLIGLPMGIWALAVLRDPAVREAFDS